MQYTSGMPVQGMLYHKLTMKIRSNYSGLGPNNVGTQRYTPMIGQSFQKPLSGSTTEAPSTIGPSYR